MAGRGCTSRGDNGWSEWGGYMAAKKRKLEEQFDRDRVNNAKQNERKSNLFNGISIFVDGYTEPPVDEIKRLMLEHGGVYQSYYSRDKVTYFVTNNLPYAKIRKLKATDKVIRSQWITDCIKQNKILPTSDYEMYREMTKPRGQTELNFKRVEPTQSTTSDFNVPDSDDEESQSDEQTPLHSEIEENGTEIDADDQLDPIDAKHPKYLETFLKRSRLHYLSSTAVAKKVYVQEMRQSNERRVLIEKQRAELNETLQRTERDYLFQLFDEKRERIYMHIDMDCFFVSVAIRNKPELQDQPVVITHSKGRRSATKDDDEQFYSRSELASCNYAARKYGVKNGMYLGQAQELCRKHQAKLICLPYDYEGYHEVSGKFYDIILSYTLEVEAVSCDEMYVDLTELILALKPMHPLTFVSYLRDKIQKETNCPCSAGLGSNMLLARLATKHAKPNGQYYVERGFEQEFIGKQKLIDLPGIGSSLLEKIQQSQPLKFIETCKHVQTLFSLDQLKSILGKKQGQSVYEISRGIDARTLSKDYSPKSISVDVNYGIRFESFDELSSFVKQIAVELQKRLQQAKQRAKQLTVKIRVRSTDAPIEPAKFMGCGKTDDSSRLINLYAFTDESTVIETEVIKLLKQMKFIVSDLRGIGVTMTQFQPISKTAPNKDGSGIRTIFACGNFRIEQKNHSNKANDNDNTDDNDDIEIIRSSTTRKRSIAQEPTSNTTNKLLRRDLYITDQIDPTVINELPTQIQEEVADFVRNQTDEAKGKTDKEEDEQIDIVEKSFTQVMDHIDESVLNELPAEMRREILMAQKLRKLESKYPSVGVKRAAPAATTTSTSSITKEKPNAFNLMMNSPQKQITNKKSTNPIKKWRTETGFGEEPRIPTSRSESRLDALAENQQQQPKQQNTRQPTIAGCSTLNEVKFMLREWIESGDEPVSIDLDLFQNYLIQLLNTYNAEMVQNLLSYGLREIRALEKKKWNEEFHTVIEAVQTRFRQMYSGAKMLIS